MEHLRGTPPQHNPFIWFLWRFDFRLISCSVLFVGLSTWRLAVVVVCFCCSRFLFRGGADVGRWSISYHNIFVLFDLRLATSDHSLAIHTPDSGFLTLSVLYFVTSPSSACICREMSAVYAPKPRHDSPRRGKSRECQPGHHLIRITMIPPQTLTRTGG